MMPVNGYFHRWTEEQIEFLRKNYPGRTNKEITILFNQTFELNQTENSVTGQCKRHKIRNGIDNRFKKGQIPANKGKRMSEEQYKKCSRTMFKKGNIPKKHKQLGSESITRDGYVLLKIGEPNIWEFKHILVMQSILGRKLEQNEIVRFLDGNRQNCDPDNLYIVSKSIHSRLNIDGFKAKDRNISKAKFQNEQLKELIRKKAKNGANDNI